MAKANKEANLIKVTLIKSTIGRIASHRACVAGLGFHATVSWSV